MLVILNAAIPKCWTQNIDAEVVDGDSVLRLICPRWGCLKQEQLLLVELEKQFLPIIFWDKKPIKTC